MPPINQSKPKKLSTVQLKQQFHDSLPQNLKHEFEYMSSSEQKNYMKLPPHLRERYNNLNLKGIPLHFILKDSLTCCEVYDQRVTELSTLYDCRETKDYKVLKMLLLFDIPECKLDFYSLISEESISNYIKYIETYDLPFLEANTILDANAFNRIMATTPLTPPLNLPYKEALCSLGIDPNHFITDYHYINHTSKLFSERGWETIYQLTQDKFRLVIETINSFNGAGIESVSYNEADKLAYLLILAVNTNHTNELIDTVAIYTKATYTLFVTYCFTCKIYTKSDLISLSRLNIRSISSEEKSSLMQSLRDEMARVAILEMYREELPLAIRYLEKFSTSFLNQYTSNVVLGYSFLPYLCLDLTSNEIEDMMKDATPIYTFGSDSLVYWFREINKKVHQYKL